MPSNIYQAISRQWELLRLLPRRPPGKSARDLANSLAQNGYKVSKRTIERDLNELCRFFPIACNDRGVPYGWHWVKDAYLDLPGLTIAEAMSTRLLEDYLKPMLPVSILRTLAPRFKHAKEKLEGLENNNLRNWTNKVRVVPAGLNLLPPNIDLDVLESIQEALLADNQVEITYQAVSRVEETAQTINPLGLVQRGSVTYLVANAFDYDEPRIYALHRIIRASVLPTRTTPPRNFDLEQYISLGAFQFGNDEIIKLRARISKTLAKILIETPISEDMKIKTNQNDCLLSCTTPNTWQLNWWIMANGDQIEILQPLSLRKWIMAKVQSIQNIYSPSESATPAKLSEAVRD